MSTEDPKNTIELFKSLGARLELLSNRPFADDPEKISFEDLGALCALLQDTALLQIEKMKSDPSTEPEELELQIEYFEDVIEDAQNIQQDINEYASLRDVPLYISQIMQCFEMLNTESPSNWLEGE